MKLKKEKTAKYAYSFEFPFTYEALTFCRLLKGRFGSKAFGFSEQRWRFTEAALDAVALIKDRYPQTEVDSRIYGDIQQAKEDKAKDLKQQAVIVRVKDQTRSDLVVPGIKGKPYPYQMVGVEFIEAAGGNALVADPMGLGKTLQALIYAVHAAKEKTLVICPASVKSAWRNETLKWTYLKPMVISGGDKFTVKDFNSHDVFIVNYDLLADKKVKNKVIEGFHHKLSAYRFDYLIGDECHYIKNSSAKRTKVFKSIARRIKSIVLLSGTPFMARPAELFNSLNVLDPKTWNDYFQYCVRYANGHQDEWGHWDASGSSNVEELAQRIQRYYIRRDKATVLTMLPPKRYIGIPVELDEDTVKRYKKGEKELRKAMKDDDTTNALVQLNAMRKETTQGKMKALRELLESLVDSGEKTLVFSVYNFPLEELHAEYADSSVIFTGKTPTDERQGIIDRFQKDPSLKLFFGGLVAAGTGITLTAATNVVFLDFSWSPHEHKQAEDRIHRPGQTADSVAIYQLYAENTIDARMKAVLDSKQDIVDRVIGDKVVEVTEKDIMRGLLGEYRP